MDSDATEADAQECFYRKRCCATKALPSVLDVLKIITEPSAKLTPKKVHILFNKKSSKLVEAFGWISDFSKFDFVYLSLLQGLQINKLLEAIFDEIVRRINYVLSHVNSSLVRCLIGIPEESSYAEKANQQTSSDGSDGGYENVAAIPEPPIKRETDYENIEDYSAVEKHKQMLQHFQERFGKDIVSSIDQLARTLDELPVAFLLPSYDLKEVAIFGNSSNETTKSEVCLDLDEVKEDPSVEVPSSHLKTIDKNDVLALNKALQIIGRELMALGIETPPFFYKKPIFSIFGFFDQKLADGSIKYKEFCLQNFNYRQIPHIAPTTVCIDVAPKAKQLASKSLSPDATNVVSVERKRYDDAVCQLSLKIRSLPIKAQILANDVRHLEMTPSRHHLKDIRKMIRNQFGKKLHTDEVSELIKTVGQGLNLLEKLPSSVEPHKLLQATKDIEEINRKIRDVTEESEYQPI